MSWTTFGMLNHSMLGKIISICQNNHVKIMFLTHDLYVLRSYNWPRKILLITWLHDTDRLNKLVKCLELLLYVESSSMLGKSISVYQIHAKLFLVMLSKFSKFLKAIINQESTYWILFTWYRQTNIS